MSSHSTMKLLLISLVSFSVVLVQNIGARPYPQESTSSSWFSGSWLGTSSSDYGVDTLITSLSSDISEERADLLNQGTILANQVLARPYPQSSSSLFSWFSNDGNADVRAAPSTIFEVGTNLLSDGAEIAQQVLGSVSEFGQKGMDMAGNLGQTALDAVYNFAETSRNTVSSGLNFGQEMISSGTETFRSGRDAVLRLINQVIQGIEDSASAVRQYFPY